jgi:hypothetical protein
MARIETLFTIGITRREYNKLDELNEQYITEEIAEDFTASTATILRMRQFAASLCEREGKKIDHGQDYYFSALTGGTYTISVHVKHEQ